MKVTQLKQQVKRADRFSIYIDNKYSFSLSSDELLTSKLYVGLELTSSQLSDLVKLSENSLVKAQCNHYLSYRLRSKWEMETYLKRKGYSPKIIDDTLKYLTDKKLVDDREFASRWIENRLLLKPTSINILKLELKQKHISSEIINSELKSREIDELPIINQLIEKKRQSSKYQDNLKLMQFLARRGFSYDLIKRALNDTSN
jgi:regulatory protein